MLFDLSHIIEILIIHSIAVISCIGLALGYFFIFPFVTKLFIKKRYLDLDKKQTIDYLSRFGSSVHALYCTCAALFIYFTNTGFFLLHSHETADVRLNYSTCFSLGYFAYDGILLIWKFFFNGGNLKSEGLLLFHHINGIIGLEVMVLCRNIFHINFMLYWFTEVTSIPMNMVFTLKNLKFSKKSQMISSIIVLVLWVIIRLGLVYLYGGYLVFFRFFEMTNHVFNVIGNNIIGWILIGYAIYAQFLTMSLNGFWGYKIFAGFFRILKKNKLAKEKERKSGIITERKSFILRLSDTRFTNEKDDSDDEGEEILLENVVEQTEKEKVSLIEDENNIEPTEKENQVTEEDENNTEDN